MNNITLEEVLAENARLLKEKANLIDELDKKQTELESAEKRANKYGLNWDKNFQPEGAVLELENNIPLLKNVKERNIIKNDGKRNMLIEGDNLHTLVALQNTNKGKIDVIEIDPPYNTGSENFIYTDNFGVRKSDNVSLEDGRRHTKWLNFMDRRLRLARELLSDEGVIFIHIDDNELFQLKLLCDSVFGEYNFISNVNWVCNPGGRSDSKFIAKTKEYVLIYAKNINSGIDFTKAKISVDVSKFSLSDTKGSYKKGASLEKTGTNDTLEVRPKMGYSIYYNPMTNDVIVIDETFIDTDNEYRIKSINNELKTDGYERITPRLRPNGKQGCWRWGIDGFLSRYKDEIIFDKTKDGYRCVVKERISVDGIKETRFKDIVEDIPNTSAAKMLMDMFGDRVFDFSKPSNLIKHFIALHPNKDAIVLDFFAGSGTTGQAVLELNAEDGGNRQFILATNNENQICENVTYQRLAKIINGYTGVKSKKVYDGHDANLEYYKVELVPYDSNEVEQQAPQHYRPMINSIAETVRETIGVTVPGAVFAGGEIEHYTNEDGTKSAYFMFETDKYVNNKTAYETVGYDVTDPLFDTETLAYAFYKVWCMDKAEEKVIYYNGFGRDISGRLLLTEDMYDALENEPNFKDMVKPIVTVTNNPMVEMIDFTEETLTSFRTAKTVSKGVRKL